MAFALCQVTQTIKRILPASIICMNRLTIFLQRGFFRDIEKLMHHIFEEQYELGLDYMQLLYMQPTQKLPILLLVSEERNTGKTTFPNFLKSIFQTMPPLIQTRISGEPVQCRLGWQATHRCGRGAVES